MRMEKSDSIVSGVSAVVGYLMEACVEMRKEIVALFGVFPWK